ncbi:hypothetical protein GLGCALEP_03203 [Pseudomonas sp. MM221]|uniref:hypothetical protein n=1 Tax=Pseudomonas aeruginosa TaxID=287 RepID=UPI00221FCF93|nr:hypothetical protein DBADOPDK_03130 [Pseudomonas sp. MM223]CAI3803300.1 hypothetical protein GLGCALEP_03203 [Pseudomonas sp. MM221]
MDISTLIKVIAAVGAILTAAKVIHEFSLGGQARRREEYRFAKEFLNDLHAPEGGDKLHPLAVERGLYAIAGTASICPEDVEYLLTLASPDRALKDFAASRVYVEIDHKLQRVQFKTKYRSGFSRGLRKIGWLLCYFGASILAASPLLLAGHSDYSSRFMWLAVVTLPCGGLYAYLALRDYIRITRAETLVTDQKKHRLTIQVHHAQR